MRIAVATEDRIIVSGHVEKCNGFLIFDIEKGKILAEEYRKNICMNQVIDENQYVQDEHDRAFKEQNEYKNVAEELVDSQYLIALGLEKNLNNVFHALGIKTIVTAELNAKSAALMLEHGRQNRNIN